jgi:chromosome segregation ATPase
VAVKEAFITDLRAEILATHRVTADLTVERDNLLSHLRDLTAQRDNLLSHQRDLTAQLDNLLSHQRELEASLSALTTYAQSAGFRLVERVIVQLKRVPLVFGPVRAIVRMAAGRRDGHP